MKNSRLNITLREILAISALTLVLFFTPFLLSSCVFGAIGELAEAGCEINRIIYTNDHDKYAEGKTFATEIYDKNGNLVSEISNDDLNIYFIETGKSGVYDLLISNRNYDGTEATVWSAAQEVKITYNHFYPISIAFPPYESIFGGNITVYGPEGEFICTNDKCICGHSIMGDGVDSDYLRCGCDSRGYSYTGVPLTHEQVLEHFGDLCEECFAHTIDKNGNKVVDYTTVELENGNVEYSLINICDHGTSFIHDGTLTSLNDDENFNLQFGDVFKSTNPKELIVDGYDFGAMKSYVEEQNVIETWETYYIGNWKEIINPYSYAHMFSDLPVEKITIKNVTGLTGLVDMSSMFENCVNLKTVDFGNLFENCQPTSLSRMFYNCPNLRNVDLTSIDTSKTTDMSDMFALQGETLTAKTRKVQAEKYLNEYIKTNPDFADLNDGTVYTIETLIAKVKDLYGEEITETELYVMLVQLGAPLTLTYDEFCLGWQGCDFNGVYQIAQTNPEQLELASGSTYNLMQVIKHVEDFASANNMEVIHEMDFMENKTRDGMVNYFINKTLVPTLPELDSSLTYDIKSIAEFYEITETEVIFDIVYGLIQANSTIIPITYNEICLIESGGEYTFNDFIDMALANPDEFDVPPKEDGTNYNRTEMEQLAMDYIDEALTSSGFVVVDDATLQNYYTQFPVTAGTLTLGGEGSKFVIKNGTNTTNMFGLASMFDTIVTPNEIGSKVVIVLSNRYSPIKIPEGQETEEYIPVVSTITRGDVEKTLYYYAGPIIEEPSEGEDETEEGERKESAEELERKKYIVMFIFIFLITTMIIIIINILIRTNRRRKIRRFALGGG